MILGLGYFNLLLINQKLVKEKTYYRKAILENKRFTQRRSNAVIPETPKQLQDCIDILTSKGVQINKVKYAIFQTKNGLKYLVLIASEKILSNGTLVLVPKDLLLTTRHVFESPLKQMFLDHQQYFSNQFYPSWEDHQLQTFILYEYQRGTESEWHLIISNLPRVIDYLVFWNQEEQDILDDEKLFKLARKQHQEFLVEYETLKSRNRYSRKCQMGLCIGKKNQFC